MTARFPLAIGDGRDWLFTNGEWIEDGDGHTTVDPAQVRRDGSGMQGHHLALHTGGAYADVRVRFEFMLRGHTDLGIVLRAQDASSFYLLHFPCCGQARRAQHFWAAFSRMDESGYLRCIKLEMIRRVPSNIGRWMAADLALTGDRIRVQIDEHGVFEAEDDAIGEPGRLGLFLHSIYNEGHGLRRVEVEAEPAPSSPWRDGVIAGTNWRHPVPTEETQGRIWQHPIDLVRFDDGEVLLHYQIQRDCSQDESAQAEHRLVRSSDRGRTWSEPEVLADGGLTVTWSPPRLHLTPAGRLVALISEPETGATGWRLCDSKDRGRSWSVPEAIDSGPVPAHISQVYIGPQAFLNTADGALVLMAYGSHDLAHDDVSSVQWGAQHWQAFSSRSTDDGRAWSPFVNFDNSARDPDSDQLHGNLDVTEVSAADMGDGRVMALLRPMYSPWMWESWSHDGGATWGPCVRGPFPGYALSNMLRTGSGAVLVAGRLPSMCVRCSFDDGRTWDTGTVIDGSIWCMGCMGEVEPDLVLYCYWDCYEGLMRSQLLTVRSGQLEPG
ncbi:MAG: hypothetical protein CMJ18_06120 [Phycisphaeraceae bacterium]|nr:hypothetical protein [Phycisphaeraceae bacterium]